MVNARTRNPVLIENLNDEAINSKVDEAYRTKYAGQGAALRQAVSLNLP